MTDHELRIVQTIAEKLDAAPPGEPRCAYCGVKASEDSDTIWGAEADEMTPAAYARLDGTFNPASTVWPEGGSFACNRCYVKLGCPSGPTGWKAP